MRHHIRFLPVALVIATLLGQFAGMALYAAPANAAPATGTQQRQQVALSGGDLVDVAAANSSLVLGVRAAGSQNVQDPASSLLTVDTVGDSVKVGLDATSIAGNLPAGAQSGDVTLTLVKAVTPDTGGVQARDDTGAVVLGSGPEDSKTVTIPANGRRVDSWVFNAQGRFTLTFQASAEITAGGKAITWKSQEMTYAIQAGGPVKPIVTLTAANNQVESGADVPLTATLDSQQAVGSMSFKDGDKELGAVAVKDGTAAYTAKSLSDGKHSIVATFTPADSTEYVASSSQSVVVKVGKSTAPTVFEGGSLELVPKMSTDQDTSDCSQYNKCTPNKIEAGLVDRTQIDRSTAAKIADRPWNSEQWYAPDDAIIHVGLRSDGYTMPTAHLPGQSVQDTGYWHAFFDDDDTNIVEGTNQTVPEYLGNKAPNNLLLGVGQEIGNSNLPAKGINSEVFTKGLGSINLQFGKLSVAPDGGRVTATVNSFGNILTQDSNDQGASTPWSISKIGLNSFYLPQWSFSKPGVYCLPITATYALRLSGGGRQNLPATGVYTFVVGDTVDPKTVTPCSQDAGSSSAPSNQPTNVLTGSGHHDIRIYRTQGADKFTFGLDAASGPLSQTVWANTMGPTTVAKPTADTDMRAIGPVGTKYWYFPNSSDTNPWPGFSAESLKVSDFQSPVTWRFTGFSRDGVANPSDTNLAMLADTTRSSRTMSLWNTRLGFPTAFEAAPLTHFHPVWAFTQPGIYCVAMQATAKTSGGQWISGGDQITMVVGTHADDPNIPEDLTKVTPCDQNGKAVPVAPTKSTIGATTASGTYRPNPADNISTVAELGWDSAGNLQQVDSMAQSVDDTAVRRDPNDVIFTAPTFEPRSAAWMFGGAQGTNYFAFDTTSLRPDSVKNGTVHVQLGDSTGPKDGVVGLRDVSNWPSPMQLSTAAGGQRDFDIVSQGAVGPGASGLWWSFTKSGVYCVPVTVSATSVDGTTHSSEKTYTFIAGNTTDPKKTDYVDASKVTTCSRGQNGKGAENASSHNGDSTVSHADIYVPNGSKTDSGAVILNQGHVDIASKLNGSTFQTWVKDSTEPDGIVRWQPLAYSNANRDPIRGQPPVTTNGETDEYTTSKGVVFQAFPDSKTTVPAESKWGFLGKTGSEIYQLPQVQDPNLLWAGWSTQAMTPDQTKTGVQWTLNKLQMLDGKNPTGQFSIYESDTFGNPSVLFHANGANVDRNTFTISKNAHVHANWSFGGQGTYCMAFTRATELPDGHEVQDAFTLAVAVGAVNVRKVDPYQCFNGKAQQASSAPIGASASNSGKPATVTSTNKTRQLDACTATSTLTSQAAQTKTILSFGHMDYNAQIRNGQLRSYIGDDSTGQRIYRDPATTVLWLKPESQVTIPGGYESVAPGGTPVWQIPQTQNPDLVWLGWSTELLNAGLASSPVDWELTAVDGPGTVKVYTTGSFGGVEQMVFDGPGSHTIALGSHVHANWAFSQQGVYRLHFTESVRLANGAMSSDSEVLTVVVGNVDPTAVASAGGGTTSAVVGNNCGGLSTAALKIPTVNPANAQSAGGQTKVLPSEGLGSLASSHKNSAEQADMTAVRLLEVAIGVLLVGGVLGAGVLWRRQLGLKALIAAAGLH
jgi:putative ABC transporter-associated repeat protein